jgi:hypothetical protein
MRTISTYYSPVRPPFVTQAETYAEASSHFHDFLGTLAAWRKEGLETGSALINLADLMDWPEDWPEDGEVYPEDLDEDDDEWTDC